MSAARRERASPAEELAALLRERRYTPHGEAERPAVAGVLVLDARGVTGSLHCPLSLLAQALSLEAGGLWMVQPAGLTWVLGRRVAQWVPTGQVAGLEGTRALVRALTGEAAAWSAAGLARGCLRWVGGKQIPRRGTTEALLAPGWACHSHTPGRLPEAGLWDLESAYFSALCRLPSPAVDWLPDGPVWHPLPEPARSRWPALLAAIAPDKGLRNRVVGCMNGGGGGGEVWHRGRKVQGPRACGPYRHGALTVVRGVHELCALAAHEGEAVWSHTDAVILPERRQPEAWARYGYRYREEARGPAEVCHGTVYRVGSRQTVLYGQGARFPLGPVVAKVPVPLTLACWH